MNPLLTYIFLKILLLFQHLCLKQAILFFEALIFKELFLLRPINLFNSFYRNKYFKADKISEINDHFLIFLKGFYLISVNILFKIMHINSICTWRVGQLPVGNLNKRHLLNSCPMIIKIISPLQTLFSKIFIENSLGSQKTHWPNLIQSTN